MNQRISKQTMKTSQIYSLIFVRRKHEVLLGYKTRGLGKGLWNGFGGKVEAGETLLHGAARELREESNLESDHLKRIGIVTYQVLNKNHEQIVHIFATDKYRGTIAESEEMSPIRWFPENALPYEKMWPDAASWLPIVFDLPLKYFSVDVVYENDDKIKSVNKKLFDDEKSFVTL